MGRGTLQHLGAGFEPGMWTNPCLASTHHTSMNLKLLLKASIHSKWPVCIHHTQHTSYSLPIFNIIPEQGAPKISQNHKPNLSANLIC